MDWKEKIAGCFGEVDQIFAVHPLDERRAFELLALLYKQQIPWDEVREAFKSHLQSKNCGQEHITEQLSMVQAKYEPWL